MSGHKVTIIVKRVISIILLLLGGILMGTVLNRLLLPIEGAGISLIFFTLGLVSLFGGAYLWGWSQKKLVLGIFLIIFGLVHMTEKIIMWVGNVRLAGVIISAILLIIGIVLIKLRGEIKREDKAAPQ